MTHKSYFLSGEKIALRAVEHDDVEAYVNWLNDSKVTFFLELGLRPAREAERETFWNLANATDDAVVFAMDNLATGKIVGTCGLYMIQWPCRRAQFNILIGDRRVWDNGFGHEATRLCLTYAFDKLNLNSIQLGVNASNARAVKAYEKAGFVHEGVRRQFIYRNGVYSDMAVMSVLREDYEANT